MTIQDDFRTFLRTLLFRGSWWEGDAVERFLDGIVRAFGDTVERIWTLPDAVAPFNAERPVLEQWYEYLAVVDCVAIPSDTEDLRTRVLALLAAESTAFFDGLERTVLAYLPLIEINDLLPISALGWNTSGDPAALVPPFPCDPWADVVEAWYPLDFVPREQVVCVLRPFIPGVAVVRPVAPSALFYGDPDSVFAGDWSLQWSEMRSSTELVLERRDTGTDNLLETVTVDPVEVSGIKLISDLFPLLSAASSLAGQYVSAAWTRTYSGVVLSPISPTIRSF